MPRPANNQHQHWIYPINPNVGFELIDPRTNRKMPATVPNLMKMIQNLNGDVDRFPLSSGYKSMRPSDYLWIYFGLPLQQLVALALVDDVFSEGGDWYAALHWDLVGTRALKMQPIPLAAIGRPPQSIRRALSAESISDLNAFLSKHSST